MSSLAAASRENLAMSSIFISNISLDISDELLKGLFSEVGQIVNFRVLTDKSLKNSKIAFCEYKDPEMAITAIRGLNGYEIKGQVMEVDFATSEKCRQELERLQGTIEAAIDNPDSTSDKAPEEISKAVASLPAEQMFELMKQMKMCVENNPQEARNLLLQNPQLAYALLQAQVIMRIVDPTIAIKILNRPSPPDLNMEDKSEPIAAPVSENAPTYSAGMSAVTNNPMAANVQVSHTDLNTVPVVISGPVSTVIPSAVAQVGALGMSAMAGSQNLSRVPNQFADQDLCTLGDQDLRTLPNLGDQDMRTASAICLDKDLRQPMGDQDFRVSSTVPENRPFDPRFRNIQGPDRNTISGFERTRPTNVDPRTAHDPRNSGASTRVEDPRKASLAATLSSRLSAAGPALQSIGPNVSQSPIASAGMTDEQEKAALIMQVLQLTDQQIAALPPEQRQSILVLKEQLARSQVN